jgi:tRNA dimethylallyltransferase
MAERKGIPHHLMDVVNPDEEFNASIYRSLTKPLIEDMKRRRKACFIVGGTGLYIKTLLGGLLKCPPADPDLREELNREHEKLGSLVLHQRLVEIDPESGDQIHPNDKTRLIRALEVIILTKQPLSSLVREHGFRETPFQALKIALHLGREVLYERINQRSVSMMEAGLVDETRALLAKGYSRDLKPMKSLGYRHIVEFLDGKYGMKETLHRIQRDTRRYAKRQLTWFRGDSEMIWVEPARRAWIEKKIKAFYERDTQ